MADTRNLFNKIWDLHTVRQLPGGQTQLFIGLHLIHEVTSPQAFEILRDRGLKVAFPQRTIATVDHIVPTAVQTRPFVDDLAEQMMSAIERNCAEFGVTLLNLSDERQGIVHVVGPEQGLTQPGMTIVCGDSHTSTHGAFGSIALGIGTSNVAEVLATQTMFLDRPKVRRVVVNGTLSPGVYAKDVILHIIQKLGVQGGVGYAYEFAGTTFDAMSMEERMTVCNMSIEGGLAAATSTRTRKQLITSVVARQLRRAPILIAAAAWWLSLASGPEAQFDDEVVFNAADIEPTVTWGITPAQSVGVSQALPRLAEVAAGEQKLIREALDFMGLNEGQPIRGTRIDVAFIGSCTNSRISDLREAARVVRGTKWLRMSVRSLSQAHSWCENRRCPKVSTESLRKPALNGAPPGVPCALP
jgi:3-isopropylmalate/(R)-2-methylmalate dehydratase large subunit